MSIWVLLKFFVKMNHNTMDLLTKKKPVPARRLGENLKSSSTGKFVVHVVKGAVNSNSLINPSCRRDSTFLGGSNGFLGGIWT